MTSKKEEATADFDQIFQSNLPLLAFATITVNAPLDLASCL